MSAGAVQPYVDHPPRGTAIPLVVSIPHTGTEIPAAIAARMAPGISGVADTDWHLHQLYDFVPDLGAHLLCARYSRTVVDLNRPVDAQALYPGRDETTVVPLSTFAGERIYQPGLEPDAAEIGHRIEAYWRPYHARIRALLDEHRRRFGFAVLFDAHSIRSEVPRFFPGRLDCLVLGDDDGRTVAPRLRRALEEALAASPGPGFRLQVNTPFKGGTITRSFGAPADGIHAVQLEMGQCLYLDEDRPDVWDSGRAAALRAQLEGALRGWTEAFLRSTSS
jgi:N-formylglutamate deformylase